MIDVEYIRLLVGRTGLYVAPPMLAVFAALGAYLWYVL